MSAITDRFARTRQMARLLFPQFSRRMKAKWVLAKLAVHGARVPVSSAWSHDPDAFRFARVAK